MNVSLGAMFEEYVEQQVDGGRYNNASEVIRDALRLKMQADEERAAKLEALRRDISVGVEQIRNGKVVKTSYEKFVKRTPRGRRA